MKDTNRNNFHKVVKIKPPVEPYYTCRPLSLAGIDLSYQPLGLPVGNLDQPVVDLGCPRCVETVRVQVKRAGLVLCLEDVWDVDEENVVEEVGKLWSSASF